MELGILFIGSYSISVERSIVSRVGGLRAGARVLDAVSFATLHASEGGSDLKNDDKTCIFWLQSLN